PVNGVAVGGPTSRGSNATAIPDGVGGWYVAWEEYKTNPSSSDVYVQRVAPTGDLAPGWPVDGLIVSNGPKPELIPRLAQDGSGGVLMAWVDGRNNNGDIYVQRIRGDGAIFPGWPAGGAPAVQHF